MSKKLLVKSIILVMMAPFLILATGCDNKKKEKMIVGKWVCQTSENGIDAESIFIFEKGGSFTQKLQPKETNSVGFEVKGKYEIDLFGNLDLTYFPLSLRALPTPDFYDPYGTIKDEYLTSVKREFAELLSEGDVYPIEFGANGEYLDITTDEGENRYIKSGSGLSEKSNRQKPRSANSSASGFNFGNIPTSGSIQQFIILSNSYIDREDLMAYSKGELRILRNAIYAMHNYMFDSVDLQNYFGNFYDYSPVTKNVTLNKVEQANVNLIKSME